MVLKGLLVGRRGKGLILGFYGSVEAQGDRGRGFRGCSRNKCREHRETRGEKPLSRTGRGQIGALGVSW